jgi:hypothetical protein
LRQFQAPIFFIVQKGCKTYWKFRAILAPPVWPKICQSLHKPATTHIYLSENVQNALVIFVGRNYAKKNNSGKKRAKYQLDQTGKVRSAKIGMSLIYAIFI